MNKRVLVGLAVMVLLVILGTFLYVRSCLFGIGTCSVSNPPGADYIGNVQVVDNPNDYDSNYPTIEDAYMKGKTLFVSILYPSGCADRHKPTVYTNGRIAMSYPARMWLTVVDDVKIVCETTGTPAVWKYDLSEYLGDYQDIKVTINERSNVLTLQIY